MQMQTSTAAGMSACALSWEARQHALKDSHYFHIHNFWPHHCLLPKLIFHAWVTFDVVTVQTANVQNWSLADVTKL